MTKKRVTICLGVVPPGQKNPVAKNLRLNKAKVIEDKRRKPPKHKEKTDE